MNNLKNSFPDKTDEERKAIAKKYYRYLCDLSLETFRTLTASQQSAIKHCYMNPAAIALFNSYYDANKNVILVTGHQGNWEWSGNAFSLQCKHQLFVIYHPLSNPYFDRLLIKIRTRMGTKLIPMNDTFREMVRNRTTLNTTAFIADQTPSSGENAYWTKFLNQDTPVFWGTEIIARKMNVPVVYVTVKRIKRGYYEIFAETLHDNPASTSTGEISELHTRRLEKDILNQPEVWLWSHRRWKHKIK